MLVGGILACNFSVSSPLELGCMFVSVTPALEDKPEHFAGPPATPGFHLRSLVSYITLKEFSQLYPQGVQAIQLHLAGCKDSLSLQIIVVVCCNKRKGSHFHPGWKRFISTLHKLLCCAHLVFRYLFIAQSVLTEVRCSHHTQPSNDS